MTAWSRDQRAKRRRRGVATGAVALVATGMWPTLAAHASDAWERHVLAEARGDTAQTIAVKVGRAVVTQGGADRVTVQRAGDGCVVAPVGVPVDCATKVTLTGARDGVTVTAQRHGETFTWDSRAARA